ncbi:MAG: GMC family oxidoreductase N-terminal domain-containing protein [Candidatus Alcyoniella australis]|nr:GMC family oxidoreductase N-terminal domain-containing protein [Candidatus Alcyoniella australis]
MVGFAIVGRLFLSYPAVDARAKNLSRRQQLIVEAIGEAMLPEGGAISPSAKQAGVLKYIDEYIVKIAPFYAFGIKALLVMLEQATLIFVPSWRRFSQLSVEERQRYLAGWEESKLYLRRTMFTSVRALFSMGYLDDAEVQKQMGVYRPEGCEQLVPEAEGVDFYAGVKQYQDYSGDLRESCDVLVVGSGPAGAIVAKEAAQLGRDVVLIEEGPIFGPDDFVLEPGESMHRWCREDGLRVAQGNIFLPNMAANCLGGTSVTNSAICARPPDFIYSGWSERHRLEGISREALDPHFDRVHQYLGIRPVADESLGLRNTLFRDACEKLGLDHQPIERNETGCKGCAECFTGCPTRAKKSMDLNYVPDLIKAGGRVYTSMRGEELLIEGRRVRGMRARAVDRKGNAGHTLTIIAKTVVLAAGVMATPLILQKNKAANSSGQVGRNLQYHPGAAIGGFFPEPVNPWEGATQGWQSLHFLDQGFKLEVLWSPLPILAVRFPDFGFKHKEHLAMAKNFAPWDTIVRTKHSFGTVKAKRGWNPIIKWNFDQRDVKVIQRGLGALADLFFAAGADYILPGLHGVPSMINSSEQAQLIKTFPLKATDMVNAGNHIFGTTRMGGDPATSVVDPAGKCHDYDNLYIADTGILPEGTGVNPMFTIMAIADRMAQKIHEGL